MTVRRLLEAFLKILGIYYAVSAVQQAAYLLALWRAHPPREFNLGLNVIVETPSILSKAVVAAVLLLGAAGLTNWLLGHARAEASGEVEPALSRLDLLYAGTCLVGLVFVLMAIPDIGRFAVLAFWYAGADRQVQAGQLWSRTAFELLLRSVVGGLAGLVLVVRARQVSAWLERRADGDSGGAEPNTDS